MINKDVQAALKQLPDDAHIVIGMLAEGHTYTGPSRYEISNIALDMDGVVNVLSCRRSDKLGGIKSVPIIDHKTSKMIPGGIAEAEAEENRQKGKSL